MGFLPIKKFRRCFDRYNGNYRVRSFENRDWRIYCDFAQILIHEARQLYSNDDFGLQLQETVYALDASIIDLCLSIFPWARFRKTKGGIKLHTLLDLRGSIPSFVTITTAGVHEVNTLDDLIPGPGAIYSIEKDQRLNLLTNQMTLPAITIADLYRCRWQVELFFKWIKQHLRSRAFYLNLFGS